MKKPILALVALALMGLAGVALIAVGEAQQASPIVAIKAGKIYIGNGKSITGGTILIRQGKITAIGKFTPPKKAQVVDYSKKVIMPALIDGHSQRACEKNLREDGQAITPQLQMMDAFRLFDPQLKKVLQAGVGTFVLMPDNSNIIGGQAFPLSPGVRNYGLFTARPCALKASLHSPAIRRTRRPTSLPGAIQLLRNTFYNSRKAGYQPGKAVVRYTSMGRFPLVVSSRTAAQAQATIDLFAHFNLKGAVLHNSEAYKVAKQLGKHKIPVVLAPLKPTDSITTLENPARLAKAGVPLVFSSDAPRGDERNLLMSAALAVQHGLDPKVAIRALTYEPARLYRLAGQGLLLAKQDASFLVFSGDPLALSSKLEHIYLKGKKRK